MNKNGFVEGAAIAYIAIVITKIMGALYNIPFYSIIGDKGGVIYSYAYSIYMLFLDISTSGIPIAISIVISEYNSLGKYHSRKKAYSLGLRFVISISVIAFIFLQLFATQIGEYFLADMTQGVTVQEIASAVRAVSVALLIVPFLSMKRGYLQGHKFLAPPSNSQVIEQFVRIVVVLAGSYVTIYILKMGVTAGVCVALLGAAIGAGAAQIYLQKKYIDNKEQFSVKGATEEKAEPTSVILKSIFSRCATIVLVAVTTSIYSLVDLKMLLLGLHNLAYSDEATQVIASVASTWAPKICMIISAMSLGLTSSIAPFIAENYAKGDMNAVNKKLNQAIGIVLAISVPLGTGMIIFSDPVYRVFYGESLYGGNIIQLAVIVNILASMTTVIGMAMQSMREGKAACFHTIVGVGINMALDLPCIYLFDYLGLPAYLGANAASMIGYFTTMILLLSSIKRSINFSYKPVFTTAVKTILPAVLMGAVVAALNHLWPVTQGRNLMLFVQLGIYALVGAAIYLPITYKLGVFHDVFGEEMIDKVCGKLNIRKR